MSDLQLTFFGTPRISYQKQQIKLDRQKSFALAAYLALNPQQQSRSVLAALLWPDMDDDHARSALRSTLRTLTAPMAIAWIQADRSTLTLDRQHVTVDVLEFINLIKQSSTHGHHRDMVCEACASLYEQASSFYSADFMQGFYIADCSEFDNWLMTQREWLRREYAELQRKLSQYYGEMQQFDVAIQHAHRWVLIDSLHEPAHRQLMRLLAANGQRSEAVRQYKQCVDLLDAELATPPENETTELFEAIQSQKLGSQLPIKSSPNRSTSILPPRPSLVVGRETVLHALRERLGVGGDTTQSTTLIQGWPGVGKSTTVATLAHDSEIALQYPDGVLWTSLGESPSINNEIVAWAAALGIHEPSRNRSIEDISAQITAALRDKRVLLIVDDVWRVEHAVPFRVGGQHCAQIMTTRLNDVAEALAPTAADIYHLPILTQESGLDLLEKLAPEIIAQHPDEAKELVSNLEGLPLAIHVAGRLLRAEARMGWGIQDLLNELRSGTALLLAHPPTDMLGAGRDTSATVAALLKRSTDALSDDIRRLFALLGLFVPKPATFDLAAMAIAWDIADPKPFARQLVNRGLLEPLSGGRFQMHALLVLHAQSLLAVEFGSQL